MAALEQKTAPFVVVSVRVAHRGTPFPNIERRLSLMYNLFAPWNAWCALTSQPARLYLETQMGMLRGIAKGVAKAEAESDRVGTENDSATEAQIPAMARKSNKKHRVARKAVPISANRNRRDRHRGKVRSGRVGHRAKKIQKRRAA
jgi:hypothetical protein